jgi:hypothetical protein
MVRLSGIPNEFLTGKPAAKIKKLGELILKVSRAGNDKNIKLNMNGIKYSDRYKTNKMLTDLGSTRYASLAEVEAKLQTWIADDAGLRSELAKAYFDVRSSLEAAAPKAGLSVEGLTTYFREASKVRNQDRPELVFSSKRIQKFWEVADKAIHSGNGSVAEEFLQGLVDKNTFNFKDAGRFQVVTKQTRKPAEGLTVREVFDAKENRYSTVVRINVASGEGYLNGRRFTAAELERAALKTGDKSAVARRSGANVEFVFEGVRSVDLAKAKVATVAELRERAVDLKPRATEAAPGAPRVPGRVRPMSCRAIFGA